MAPKHASGARVEQGFFGQVMRGNRQGRKIILSVLFIFYLTVSMASRRCGLMVSVWTQAYQFVFRDGSGSCRLDNGLTEPR
jgi:hypothetical protein